jgi:hypothetical protein
VKKFRAWPVCALSAALVSFSFSNFPAIGQPSKAKSAPALSFRVNAQFAYHDDEDATAPGDALNARVWVQGGKARLETTVGERPLVVIIAPPYLYKLLPRSKTGTRYKTADAAKNPGLSSLDPQPWLRDPQAIRAALKKQGAKRIGTAKLNGTPVETWSTSQLMGRRGQITAWLRQSDALPVRLEIKSKQLTATANWRDYQKISALPSSQFAPPAGFRIRAAEE